MKKSFYKSFLERRNKNTMTKLVSGFTLVEALVAISILLVAIASPMTLAHKGLSTATLSKDQMTASFLAQDAIEAVKNIRDQIAVRGVASDWLDSTGLLSPCICDSDENCNFDSAGRTYCAIDTTSTWSSDDIISDITNPGPLKISYTLSDKHFLKYDYSGANCDNSNPLTLCSSKFTRYVNIRIDPTGTNLNEAVANVRVSWNSPQGVQKIDVSSFLYNYSENF